MLPIRQARNRVGTNEFIRCASSSRLKLLTIFLLSLSLFLSHISTPFSFFFFVWPAHLDSLVKVAMVRRAQNLYNVSMQELEEMALVIGAQYVLMSPGPPTPGPAGCGVQEQLYADVRALGYSRLNELLIDLAGSKS